MKTIKFALIFFIAITLISCDPHMIYDQFNETADNSWSWDEKQVFEVNMDNPDQFYNLYINIRHTKDYPKSNLYLFLTINGPNESLSRDTIDIPIADQKGKWLGTGFGDIKFVRKRIRENVRFAYPGEYIFTIEQGMRIEELPITDVGLRIEKFTSLN